MMPLKVKMRNNKNTSAFAVLRIRKGGIGVYIVRLCHYVLDVEFLCNYITFLPKYLEVI
jgi:hypothetical protein